jgi:hypothetical protein
VSPFVDGNQVASHSNVTVGAGASKSSTLEFESVGETVETGETVSYTLSLSTVGESATGEITTETQDQGEPELALSVEAPNEIPPIGVSKWGTRSRTSATRWRPRWRWNW